MPGDTFSLPWVKEAKMWKSSLYSMRPSSFSRSATSSNFSSVVTVKVTSLYSLFRASTSPAHIQPIQASRTDMPMTAVTYSSTRPAVRPAERRFLRRRGVERGVSSYSLRPEERAPPPSRSPWEDRRPLPRSLEL